MRVIAGKAKSLPLKTIDGMGTRPTTDRIKETLFNMIGLWVPGADVLDLFAGSGGIGIEAISRGARKAVFVEKNKQAAAVIRENLTFTRLADQGSVLEMDVFAALQELDRQGHRFDVIFMDPPYNQLWEKRVLELLAKTELLGEDGVVITEASMETSFDYVEMLGFVITRTKKYKTNQHVFLQKKSE